MKNKVLLISVGFVVLLLITGFVVYKAVLAPKPDQPPVAQEEEVESVPPADASIVVEVTKSAKKDNTVVITVKGLGSKYASVAYELTYESLGLIKGVNSGSKPIDVSGKDDFEREIYLGTCSRNVCKPDAGVTKVAVVLEFTNTEDKKSQFTKEYPL